ncbi:hypothetical protein IAD21_02766 [Abditibacteriota bacterium]|nr:hypothetical protein IAD21_02766 [Abditibacteriota bacterium]
MLDTPPASVPRTAPLTAPATRLHLDFLDGVRGLAAFSVVVHHLYTSRMGMSARSQWPGDLGNSLLYGHLAVGVFLVISGFCLALPVASSRQLARGSLAFYGKRARRILPPFLMALLGSIAIYWLRHRFAGGDSISAKNVVLNALLLQDVFPNSNVFNVPLWSVAVEWKIYFLFPAFLWVWRRFGNAALIGVGTLAGAAGTLLWAEIDSVRTWGHSCPWFLCLFSLGVVAAGLARSETEKAVQWRARLPLTALVGAIVVAALLWQFPVTGRGEFELFVPALPFIDTAMGVAAAAMMVILARAPHETSVLKRSLEWRPLVGLGTFAYSLYLTHLPLIRLLNFVLDRAPITRSSSSLATMVLAVIGVPFLIGAAFVFFVAFERPFLSRRSGT